MREDIVTVYEYVIGASMWEKTFFKMKDQAVSGTGGYQQAVSLLKLEWEDGF